MREMTGDLWAGGITYALWILRLLAGVYYIIKMKYIYIVWATPLWRAFHINLYGRLKEILIFSLKVPAWRLAIEHA